MALRTLVSYVLLRFNLTRTVHSCSLSSFNTIKILILKRSHNNLVFWFQAIANLMANNCIHIMDPNQILLGQNAFFGSAKYVNLKNQQICNKFCYYFPECYNYRKSTTVQINNIATAHVFRNICSAAAHRESWAIHVYTHMGVFILTLCTHI